MDWLILLLAPLIVIPVVLLSGFAGCSFEGQAAPLPNAPSNLTAALAGPDSIQLQWVDNNVDTEHFRIARSKDGAAPETLPVMPSTPMHPDSGLTPGTYEYQVFALRDGLQSEGSNFASATINATPATWHTTFDQGPTDTVGENRPGLGNDCRIQRIGANLLALSGPRVRITVRGSTAEDLQLNAVFISRAAATGDPWDSASDIAPVLFSGSPGVLVTAGAAVVSDETNYTLDAGQDLIIAFDFGQPGNARRREPVPGAQSYARANTAQAAMQDRGGNFQTANNNVFVVEKIEVFV